MSRSVYLPTRAVANGPLLDTLASHSRLGVLLKITRNELENYRWPDQKKGAVRGTAPTPFTVFRPEPVAAHEEKKPHNVTRKYCTTEP